MMADPDADAINKLFGPLYKVLDSSEHIRRDPPLLAHYTSLEAFEKIMTTNELWFSNPLFMNDLEEVRFAAQHGQFIFLNSPIVRDAAGSESRHQTIIRAFQHFFQKWDTEGALDIYVFCLSEHPRENTDGLLSMWRGYGGYGHGVALIFDTSRIEFVETAPMYLLRVSYASGQARMQQLNDLFQQWADIVKISNIPDNLLYVASYAAVLAIITLGLTQKHDGFAEEWEWRVVYLPLMDPKALLRESGPHALQLTSRTTRSCGSFMLFIRYSNLPSRTQDEGLCAMP